MNPHRQWSLGVLLLLSSCSSNAGTSSDHADPVDPDDTAGEVIYVGAVTDEALDRLLDATPKNDPRQVVIVDSPDLTAPLPKDSPATLEFHLATQTTRAPGLRLRPSAQPRSKWQRSFHDFLQLLGPVRIAHAHGAPYYGRGYYLVFSDAESKPRLRVFTTATSYTPESADWQRLSDAAQPLKLEITSAFFEANDIPADGGPYVGGAFSFRIE